MGLEDICNQLLIMKIGVTGVRPSGSTTRLISHLIDKPIDGKA